MSDSVLLGVKGFRLSGVSAGIKKKSGALDLGLIVADAPCAVAGTFTRNLVRAAPVDVAERRVQEGRAQVVLVNSGNANACTGQAGLEAVERTTQAVATKLGVAASLVLPASTGVIGAVLPAERIEAALPELIERLAPDNVGAFADAIMTTDRWRKLKEATLSVQGTPVRFVGIAKGAGMIHPDMGPSAPKHATMLAFILTDAVAAPPDLSAALARAVELSFNAATVDGDTSTNDTALLLASGASGVTMSQAELLAPLTEVCRALAKEMVLDGEGAEHAVEVIVSGLADEGSARQVAKTVAQSMLVKTAFYGKDANWGRLLAAAGRAGVAFDPKAARVMIGGVTIVEAGTPLGASAEAEANKFMQEASYTVELVLGGGPGRFAYLTSDLGHGYVDVNAGYRS